MEGWREAGWVDELRDGQPSPGLRAGRLEGDEVAEEPQGLTLFGGQDVGRRCSHGGGLLRFTIM